MSQKQDTAVAEYSIKSAKPAYFVSVPITKLSAIQAPCLDVEVDGIVLSMELDLGFRGNLTIPKESIHVVSSKSFLRDKPMYGVRGKKYQTNLYQIPKLRIGKMTFWEPILQEESMEFLTDAAFLQDGAELSSRESGRLGWELFYTTNLLIDIQHSRIAFCDSLDTLKQEGFAVESFIKAPLLLERGLVEFIAETPAGPLLCMLDTGATWNVLHSELENGKSVDVAVWEPDNILEYPSFKIEGVDFGPMSFHRMPIRIPIQIEAMLGMEFFQDHLVFLDFSGKSAYFSKASEE